jgi:glutathione S-transferase
MLICEAKLRIMQALFATNVQSAKKELGYWETYLEKDPEYMVGSAFTLVDISVLLTLYLMFRTGAKLEDYPHLRKYSEVHKERPSIQGSWPPHWKETPPPDWLSDL